MANENLEIKKRPQEVTNEDLSKVAGGSAVKRDYKTCNCSK